VSISASSGIQPQAAQNVVQPAGGTGSSSVAPAVVPAVSTPAVPQTPASQPASAAELQRAAETVRRHLSAVAPELDFAVDQDSGRVVVKITDPATNELLRQIPSEEVLKMNKELDRMQGLLLDHKA